jgi:hypothetical protein
MTNLTPEQREAAIAAARRRIEALQYAPFGINIEQKRRELEAQIKRLKNAEHVS